MSSGEAEFYAAIKGPCEGIGIKSLLADLGFEVKIEVVQDSTAAKGTASRAGIGKIKHLDVGWCWIQQIVEKGEVKLIKIDGTKKPADPLTKPKSAKEMGRLYEIIGYCMPTRKINREETEAGILEIATWMQEAGDERKIRREAKMKPRI